MKTKTHKNYSWNPWLVLLCGSLLMACSENDNSREIDTLNVAVLPDQSESKLRSINQPFLDHIKKHAGINSRLLIPATYEEMLQMFKNKKIDLAMFGGVTYVKAHLNANALPLVMRDVDARFKSVVFVRADNSASNIQDLKGVSFAFGSRLSTSGHLMPRFFFQKQEIIAETFFIRVQYTDAHDRTAEWVRDGKVDAGVANAGIIRQMFLDGRLDKDKVKVIWESPPYADYVWAIQPDINKKLKTQVLNAFLHMNQDADDAVILQNLGAGYYIPASHDNFKDLEQIVLQREQESARE